jgi:hypothetical protein
MDLPEADANKKISTTLRMIPIKNAPGLVVFCFFVGFVIFYCFVGL